MTPFDEGKLLRREIAQLRLDQRRRYPEELRRRVLNWVDRATDAGETESACGKALGLKSWRFTMWRRREARDAAEELREIRAASSAGGEAPPLALVPVEVPSFSSAPGLVVATPSGYRIEGLSLEQLVALLRELA